ncbi:signal peptidase I [Lacticaseibacillus camelliae]|uniref:Signal peptidase I n=2 Tax=Lacticaseibacillus camelliae TaxID=381742 RepID=A0A0R2FBQ2_9LACO|nr:signal peptidase I [Lacticaseibacillus camelliae]KRN25890.1 Signal peptidase I [Lacticaseibacillus camelliae DSM 22697 = JCM 13995]
MPKKQRKAIEPAVKGFFKWGLVVVGVAAAMFLVQLILGLFFANDRIAGESMAPNLTPGDRVVVSRNAPVARFDVITFESPIEPGREYIKRVIGMPGDTIAFRGDVLYVNGQRTPEPFLSDQFKRKTLAFEAEQNGETGNSPAFTPDFTLQSLKATHARTVPQGEYLVLGDNRPVSYDSRKFGFVKQAAVFGVVKWRYWPLNKWQKF